MLDYHGGVLLGVLMESVCVFVCVCVCVCVCVHVCVFQPSVSVIVGVRVQEVLCEDLTQIGVNFQ